MCNFLVMNGPSRIWKSLRPQGGSIKSPKQDSLKFLRHKVEGSSKQCPVEAVKFIYEFRMQMGEITPGDNSGKIVRGDNNSLYQLNLITQYLGALTRPKAIKIPYFTIGIPLGSPGEIMMIRFHGKLTLEIYSGLVDQ